MRMCQREIRCRGPFGAGPEFACHPFAPSRSVDRRCVRACSAACSPGAASLACHGRIRCSRSRHLVASFEASVGPNRVVGATTRSDRHLGTDPKRGDRGVRIAGVDGAHHRELHGLPHLGSASRHRGAGGRGRPDARPTGESPPAAFRISNRCGARASSFPSRRSRRCERRGPRGTARRRSASSGPSRESGSTGHRPSRRRPPPGSPTHPVGIRRVGGPWECSPGPAPDPTQGAS